MSSIVLVDGENFKGKIKQILRGKEDTVVLWHEYDFRGLFDAVLKDLPIERRVFYFARLREHPDSKEKSRQLIQEQRLVKTHLENQSFEVVIAGRVRGQYEDGRFGRKLLVFKEKGVDVRIAVDMVSWACDGNADEIILASSDSDLQPAIKEVRDRNVSCIYLGFEAQPNKGLSYTTNRTILIRDSEVREYQKVQRDLFSR